jgi:hypothetical protein
MAALPASAATVGAPNDAESRWSEVIALQGTFDLRAGSIDVLQTTVSSPVHRLVYPQLNPLVGDGAVSLIDGPTARVTADSTMWGTFPLATTGVAQIEVDGILVSVLGNLVFDGSADTSASCPSPTQGSGRAVGIVSGLNMFVNGSTPTWEFTREAPYLELGAAGGTLHTPDALLHIKLELVRSATANTAAVSVVLTVDLRGSLPDYGPVDQRLATITLASSALSCAVPATTPGLGTGAPGPTVEPTPPAPDAPVPAAAAPVEAEVTTSAPVAVLAASGIDSRLGAFGLAGAGMITLGLWLMRVRRRA